MSLSPSTITPARYRKNGWVARSPSDSSEFKTASHWLIERLGGRWVGRDHGYAVSRRQAARIERAWRLLNRRTK